MPAEDEAESTTKETVSEGEIEIRDKENQKQDLADLNRDTQNALNKPGEIFDNDSIKERQELAGLFGELAYNQIHYMEGTNEQKAAYHALVGGNMAELTNGDFLAGASAAAVNKMVSDKIAEAANGNPAMAQWLSAAVGAVVSEVAGGNAQSGASIAASGMKNNKFEDYYDVYDLIIYKFAFADDVAIKQALKSAVIEGYNTKQEKISLDFGDGDLIDIKIGHAYRDTHRSQQQGKVAPLTYTSKEDIVASVVSAVLFAYENHKEFGTSFPTFNSGEVEKLYSNVLLFNPLMKLG